MTIFKMFASFLFLLQPTHSQRFLSVESYPAALIEWNQQPYEYYTGQTINVTWTYESMLSSDLARIQYPGAGGTRTLTTGSGVAVGSTSYKVRLSDSSNGLASNVPLTISLASNTAISTTSTQRISVIQSKLMNIIPLDGTRILGSGQSTFCDDRNLTVRWRGLGQSQFGFATVSIYKVSGSAGTLGTTQTNIPVSGNMSVNILCPRTSTPSTFSQYGFQISILESGGSAYTGTSASFTVVVAPTPIRTPTPTNTPSNTATPTQSLSATPSPSQTSTSSSSLSSTSSPSFSSTVSGTPTPRANIDLSLTVKRSYTEPILAGSITGCIILLAVLFIGAKYRSNLLTNQRKKKLAMSNRFVQEANALYGIYQGDTGSTPTIVMYTVQTPSNFKKSFPPKHTNPK